jgi:membrane-bound lytic murein transglycosylase D
MHCPKIHLGFALLLGTGAITAAEPPSAASPPPAAAPATDELYDLGKSLFDQFAPPEVKEQYEFPSKEQWDAFAVGLQRALESDDLPQLATYEPQARAALTALQAFPGAADYTDWLEERLDYIEAAKQIAQPAAGATPSRAPKMPYYDLWMRRMQARPLPARAKEWMPTLRRAFAAEGVAPEIAWMAEVESTFNPAARSPAGATGLFQLMPATAKALGLSTFFPDERTDADKSARAAARYLRALHDKFGDWPLTFAAYNAGEGRVRRLLIQRDATTFAGIADALPSETRMYVPKVCATIAVRAGVRPGGLPRPRGPDRSG